MQLKGAYPNCKWCEGRGCLQCDQEREKAAQRIPEPLFVADRDDPADMRQLKEIVGADAIREAFGPGGGGIAEIERNAAMAQMTQTIRKHLDKVRELPK